MRFIGVIFIFTFFSISSFAALLNVSGTVYRSVDLDLSDGPVLSANSDLTIEIEDSTGQKEQHLLQYKKSLKLKKINVSRVTIYAP